MLLNQRNQVNVKMVQEQLQSGTQIIIIYDFGPFRVFKNLKSNGSVPLPFSPGLAPVQQPDPNQPKAEGAQMVAMRGEQLGVVTNWPPSLEAALQRWGTISPKAPCLTTMDTNGKPLYVLTYGEQTPRGLFFLYQ